MTDLSKFIGELQRRNVLRTGAAYLVAAWLLVQISDILLGAFGAADWMLRAIVIVLVVGFLITVVLAWLYEITSDGVMRSEELGEELSSSVLHGRQIDFVIIGVLMVAVALFASDRFDWIDFKGESGVDRITMAVLPFSFLGPDPDSEYFADSMTDELIGRLGRIDAVRIKSRLSVARFKASEQSVDDIAAELNVNFVLEGSVWKSEDRVKVRAQLTDASSGFQEWSDVFNGESDDWFKLHEEMAIKITDALNLHISPQESDLVRAHYTRNRKAYDAFWRGWLLLESFHSDVSHPEKKIRAAENHLQHALQLDPNYPLAIAGLSLANSYYYFYGVDRSNERRKRGIELAQQALAIDPDFPEGRVALGMAFSTKNDHASAVSEFRRALARDSENGMIWCLLAFSCVAQNPPDLKAAEEAARIAILHDPSWTYSYQVLGWTLFLQGRYQESAAAYQRGVEFNPDYFEVQFGLGKANLELGNFDQAMTAFEAARELGGSSEVLMYIAACHVGLGDFDSALANLERSLDQGFGPVEAIAGSPYFAPLRGDPRFPTLVESYENQ
ncbi:MAG: tetratricopeptide repeat protein [Proteobacteria bacterium]|nr:tetratricopeptide repeat protein [Pseudomonadota bacterium]